MRVMDKIRSWDLYALVRIKDCKNIVATQNNSDLMYKYTHTTWLHLDEGMLIVALSTLFNL